MGFMNRGRVMIEFKGEISGTAKKFFIDKLIKKIQFFFGFASLCMIPFFLLFAYRVGALWVVFTLYPLLVFIFCSITKVFFKKHNKKNLIQSVCIDGGYIASRSIDEKFKFKLSSVKKVVNCGEFYFVIFTKFLPIPDMVCQKNLLSIGTLEEFEILFKDKLEHQSGDGSIIDHENN